MPLSELTAEERREDQEVGTYRVLRVDLRDANEWWHACGHPLPECGCVGEATQRVAIRDRYYARWELVRSYPFFCLSCYRVWGVSHESFSCQCSGNDARLRIMACRTCHVLMVRSGMVQSHVCMGATRRSMSNSGTIIGDTVAYDPAVVPMAPREQWEDISHVLQSDGGVIPMPEEEPITVLAPLKEKAVTETAPNDPNTVLLSAKLSRGKDGLCLALKSPVLEAFFKSLAGGATYSLNVGGKTLKRYKIPEGSSWLMPQDASAGYVVPPTGELKWMVSNTVNIHILCYVGIADGLNLQSDVPMTQERMKVFLEQLRLTARYLYLSFCAPVEVAVDLTVQEHHAATGNGARVLG